MTCLVLCFPPVIQVLTNECWQLNNDKWMLTNECWQMSVDNWILTNECWQMNVDTWMLTNECWQLNVDKWMLTNECRQMNVDKWVLTIECWQMNVDKWMLLYNCWQRSVDLICFCVLYRQSSGPGLCNKSAQCSSGNIHICGGALDDMWWLLGQRSRVQIWHLPQWSWGAAGSLCNTVKSNLRTEGTPPSGAKTDIYIFTFCRNL